MGNAIALCVHTQPGEAILVDRQSHILRSESGRAACLAGAIVDHSQGDRGRFTPEALVAAIPLNAEFRGVLGQSDLGTVPQNVLLERFVIFYVCC